MSTSTNDETSQQSETSRVDHRVVVFGVPDDLQQLKDVLVERAAMDAATAQIIVRSLPGLLPAKLSQHQAAAIATGIRELGVTAVAVPAVEVPCLSHARQIHHLRINDVRLEVVDSCDQEHSCPWEKIQVVSVGVIPSTAPGHHRPASSFAMGSSHRSWNDGVQIASRKRPAAFVVLTTGTTLLLNSDEMNYEYLRGRQAPSSTANFARLIGDLIKNSSAAWITPSTRAFMGRGPVRHYEFPSVDDFQSYTEFQALLSGQFQSQP